MVPADDQEIVLPWASVIVIIVLLKVELTCATPDAMFLRSRRRTRVASFAILQFLQTRPSCQALSGPSSILGGDCLAGYLAANAMSKTSLEFTSSCRRSAWPCLCEFARWY